MDTKSCYTYNINGIRIAMYTNKPIEKLNYYLSNEKEFDLEFHVGQLLQETNSNILSAKYRHKLSHWQIQLQDFDKPHTIVYFKGDSLFSHKLFYTTVFEALLQYKYSQKNNIVLHASSVSNGRKSYAFSGDATVGKTSILLHFLSRGYHYLADDQTVINAQTLETLPYPLPIYIDLKLALKTRINLLTKHKLSLLLGTFINFVFLNYSNLTTIFQLNELIFGNKKTVIGVPTKIHKVFILENSDKFSVIKLTPMQAYNKLWKCKFGSKGRLPALIYYGEEFKKLDSKFSLWKEYRGLLMKLVNKVSVYQVSFNKKQFQKAIELIETEIEDKKIKNKKHNYAYSFEGEFW